MEKSTSNGGFTLIEALVGGVLLSLSLLGVVALMVYFSTGTADKSLRDCLLDNALNGLAQLRANATVATTFTCGSASGILTLSPNTFPALNACSDVTATASAGGKTVQMKTKICNFQ
jgi:Tfp pilus assembly protein PilV